VRPHGRDDMVVGGQRDMAQAAIGADHLHLLVAGRGKMHPCRCDNVLVNIDGHHLPLCTHDVREQGSIVPRAGANLQNTLPRLEIELFQHEGHDRGL
jgi:hypothetical protein